MRLSSLSSTRSTVFPFGVMPPLAPVARDEGDPSPGPASAAVSCELTVCSDCFRIMQKRLPLAERATGDETFLKDGARFLPAWRVRKHQCPTPRTRPANGRDPPMHPPEPHRRAARAVLAATPGRRPAATPRR